MRNRFLRMFRRREKPENQESVVATQRADMVDQAANNILSRLGHEVACLNQHADAAVSVLSREIVDHMMDKGYVAPLEFPKIFVRHVDENKKKET